MAKGRLTSLVKLVPRRNHGDAVPAFPIAQDDSGFGVPAQPGYLPAAQNTAPRVEAGAPTSPATDVDVFAMFDTPAPVWPGPRRLAGELLLTFAVLVVIFIAWAVFLSDIGANRAQAQRIEEFTSTSGPAVVSSDYTRRTSTPPAAPQVENGQTMGVVHIPALGENYQIPLAEGTDPDVLNQAAAGHYSTTAGPGEIGNFAISGHRTTYGKVFHDIEKLKDGDAIVVQTSEAWLVYRVSATLIVEPHQNEVIAPVPGEPGASPSERNLTVTTCHPLFGYSERYIVHAAFDHWVDPDEGTPIELGEV